MHHLHQFRWNLQEPKDGTAQYHHRQVQKDGHAADEKKGKLHAVLHFFLFLFPIIIGKQGAASHAHADEDGGEEGHQRIGASHSRQGIRTQELPYDEGVGDIIKLLQQVPQDHGAGEEEHISGNISAGQIFFHLLDISCLKHCTSFYYTIITCAPAHLESEVDLMLFQVNIVPSKNG